MEKEKKVVLKALKKAGKPVRPGELVEATGIDKKEMSKIIKKLVEEEKVHSPKRCFYDLK
jgi:DNA-binding MarR family transcriptional regulator